MSDSIYTDIAKRTGGDIYIGVVGPVRTGKSTFIHRLLDTVVLPNIENEFDRERALDQIPQSASGKTVMTTEPKFVPDDAVKITVADGTTLNVKMIDCVGYMVEGALGDEEDGKARMIMTPWSEVAMPFSEAAELGTSKVIGEHSSIGMLVTTDGTIGEIPREAYVEAEERVARELKEFKKPFAIVLNSAVPESEESRTLAENLEKKYEVPVALVNCMKLTQEDIKEILGLVLSEFPIKRLKFKMPRWVEALDKEHHLRRGLIDTIKSFVKGLKKLGDVSKRLEGQSEIALTSLNAGDGVGELSIPLDEATYFNTLSEISGLEISDEKELMRTLCELAGTKRKYNRVANALNDVESKGYGIVMPTQSELKLEEPCLVKQAQGYGVKVAAHAESIQMFKTSLHADLCPVVGSAEQSEEVIKYLNEEYDNNPEGVWECNMFGRSLYDLVSDGMNTKLNNMPDESREKLGATLEKIINEGASGLVCILL